MRKTVIYVTTLLFAVVTAVSCGSDDNDDGPATPTTVVTTADLNVETFSSVAANDSIGTVFGTSSMGTVSFEILSQDPAGALKIDAEGNLLVADAAPFKTDIAAVTAEVGVSSNEVQEIADVTVTILKCPELENFTGDGLVFTSAFSDVSVVSGESLTGNLCAVKFTGIDPLFTFLDCDTPTQIMISLSPNANNADQGTLTIEKQAYGCSADVTNFEVEGQGQYDLTTNSFTFDYTLLENGSEWDSGSVTVSTESESDSDGDGFTNGEEDTNGSDKQDPCDPMQGPGYTGYNADNIFWADADCDGDGFINSIELDEGTDPYEADVLMGDTDGDGISDADEVNSGSDRNNPCDPAQATDYTGYDSTNSIWAAADCDGDGNNNGDELTNGTNPYESDGTCGNDADTSIWEGNLVSENTDLGDQGTASGTAGCGSLSLTGDWLPDGFCGGDLPTATLIFTPSSAGATSGEVSISRQSYTPCDGINYELEGTGTYDETTGLITIEWSLYDIDFDPNDAIVGTTEIQPE